jgi:hypothetical protein
VSLDEAVDFLRNITGNPPLGNPRHLSSDERSMMELRDHIIASGRSVPSTRRCNTCHYVFFGEAEAKNCPRCGGKLCTV